MKQEKFNIQIKRDALRVRQDGKNTKLVYPKAFGDKEKNNFIKADQDEGMLKICTPESNSAQDVYNKLEEITNVVMLETYNNEELLWPASSKEEKNLNVELKLSIDKEYYEELKELEKESIPENLEDAYSVIKENLSKSIVLLKPVFGDIKVKTTKKAIVLENIAINYLLLHKL